MPIKEAMSVARDALEVIQDVADLYKKEAKLRLLEAKKARLISLFEESNYLGDKVLPSHIAEMMTQAETEHNKLLGIDLPSKESTPFCQLQQRCDSCECVYDVDEYDDDFMCQECTDYDEEHPSLMCGTCKENKPAGDMLSGYFGLVCKSCSTNLTQTKTYPEPTSGTLLRVCEIEQPKQQICGKCNNLFGVDKFTEDFVCDLCLERNKVIEDDFKFCRLCGDDQTETELKSTEYGLECVDCLREREKRKLEMQIYEAFCKNRKGAAAKECSYCERQITSKVKGEGDWHGYMCRNCMEGE